MDIIFGLFSFIAGTIIGSFLNVVALRFNTGMGVGGRSICLSCNQTLKWTDLVPVASFMALRGKCRTCKTKISWQYPLVEFLSGVFFVLAFVIFPPVTIPAAIGTLIILITISILIVTSVYDLKHKIIPDSLVFTFIGLGFIRLFIGGDVLFHMPTLWNLLAGPILFAPFAILFYVSKGRWMGFGDAKLAWGIGWFLGLTQGLSAIVMAFWIGAIVSVYLLARKNKRLHMSSEIPFAPYLILGVFIALFTAVDVMHLQFFMDSFNLL
jgi:prepilin signal peptidase PulO-like enzyme (type II secretory pathway)